MTEIDPVTHSETEGLILRKKIMFRLQDAGMRHAEHHGAVEVEAMGAAGAVVMRQVIRQAFGGRTSN